MQNTKILIVDDEEDICAIVSYHLNREGYSTFTALSTEDATKYDLSTFSLFILDVMLPGKSGFEFAKLLKQNHSTNSIPIIFLTALDTEQNILQGFELGGDDYIPKPFSPNILSARVKSVLRRFNSLPQDKVLQYQGIKINQQNLSLSIDNQEIAVTPLELNLLTLFLTHIGKVLSRETIIKKVWPEDSLVTFRTIDVHITRLRKKLGNYSNHIQTKTGYGYIFQP